MESPISHKIKIKGRPSPRTGTTGAGIQKFGTQQLKYLDTTQPALGVIEIDTGAITRLGFSGETSGTAKTPFSQRYQDQRPATIRTFAELETSPHAPTKGFGTIEFPDLFGNGNSNGKKEKCHLDDDKPFCGITQAIGGEVCECPDWITGETTDPTAGGRGCECEACKNGTGPCDAWDLVCEGTGGATVRVVGGTNYFFWAKIILVVIGIGILLWLLRPLFGVAKNVTGISKSAVTRVNGMK